MKRLTQKNEFFEYVLPEQNIFGDNQPYEISLGETEYTCKKYIIGEAIKKLGELEDVLEKWHIEDLDKFLEEQIAKKRELNDILWKMEQELAELKQKAIVPKFKVGQDVFIILDAVIKDTNINSITIFAGNELSYYCKYVNNERMYLELDEEEIFATKEEAEQKLAEIKGE